MRKLKIIEHISLHGVIQHSNDDDNFAYSDWTAPYRTPAGRDAMLAVYPVVLGTGKRFFAGGTSLRTFKLASSRALESGIVFNTYILT